jgi:RNA polymerase sigma-70 factor (ECF subfamily)
MNEMKTDKRRPNLVMLTADELHEEAGPAEEERFLWHDAMHRLLGVLDETKRSLFVLYEVEGYSHAEIAEILGIGQNASRTILCRVKHALRTQWELLENQA